MEDQLDPSLVVCVDLDGVLNTFDEWRGDDYFHPARPGVHDFLRRLKDAGFHVVVFTVRWHEWVQRWLEANGLAQYVARVTNLKPAARVYLDDRAICFRGDFEDALGQIQAFRPFWERTSA